MPACMLRSRLAVLKVKLSLLGGMHAFDVLMAATCERVLPKAIEPPEGKELRSDQRLYNDILGMSHIHTHTLPFSRSLIHV